MDCTEPSMRPQISQYCELVWQNHRDQSIDIERENMKWQGMICIRSDEPGLISADGQKLDCLNEQQLILL